MAAATKTPRKSATPAAKPRASKATTPKDAATKASATKASAPRTAAAKAPARKATAPKAAAAKTSAAKAKGNSRGRTQPHVGLFSAIGVGLVAAGSLFALFGRRLLGRGDAEHAAPDLALDQPHPDALHRAPEAFRPDPTAPVPAAERDGLRPATGPLPSPVTH